MQNFDANQNQAKYISAEHGVAFEKYIVNNGQIRSVYFANPDGTIGRFINDITQADITNYVEAIINQSNSSPSVKSKVTLKFEYNGKSNLTVEELYREIQNKLKQPIPFAISDGNNTANGDVIKAKFVVKDGFDSVKFFNSTGNELTESNLTSIVVSNLFTKIDLSAYLSQIINSGLTVTNTPTRPGTFNTNGNDIQFPTNQASSGFLANMNFNDIKGKLLAVGVKIRYKGYNPGTQNFGQWENDLGSITNYNPTNPEIKIGFQVNSTNWKVKMFNAGSEISENQEITIKLNLPKQFLINKTVIQNFTKDPGIQGNTKFIQFDNSKLNKLIADLKAANQNATTAKLEVMFRLGTSDDFKSKEEFIKYLKEQTTDKTTNIIQIKFAINESDANNWFIRPDQAGMYTILSENNKTLKIYINDQGIFEKLGTTKLEGNNTDLRPIWPTGYTVNPTTGALTVSPIKGVGLKLQFSFNSKLSPVNGESGSNYQTQWVDAIPTTFDINKNENLYIRLQVTDATKYVYEKNPTTENDKITLSLRNLLQKIELDGRWLSQDFANTNIDLETLNTSAFDKYEKSVKDAMTGLSNDIKSKIKIVYNFNNESNLSKEQVLEKIQSYKNNSNTVDQDFKILKLWNQTDGQKITSTFAKNDENGNYEFSYIDSNIRTHVLDTSKVITTIDFTKVLEWLQSFKVPFENGQIKIPAVNVNDSFFNGKEWNKIQQALLNNFGITIEYRSLSQTNENQPELDWTTELSTIINYDPAIGKFQIRFKVDGSKSKNIKFKTTNSETIDGATSNNKSIAYSIKLAIKLIVKINQDFANNFINNDKSISGDTKNLVIDSDLEKIMIDNIKNENKTNNNEFDSLKLLVKYQLGNPEPTAKWYARDEFIQFLKNELTDKTTNKVVFKFFISDEQNQQFGLDETNNNYVLSDYEPATDVNIKIKYYINASDWETKASQLEINGTSDNLQWNFTNVFGTNKFEEINDKVYVKTNAGLGLQLYFTTKLDATYENPEISDQASEIGSKWVSIKPNAINAGITNLKVKLVANTGYVYGPAQNGSTPVAQAHDVDINIQNVLYVEKNWLDPLLVTNELEISNLNDQRHFVPWESAIYKKIADRNSVSEAIAKKIKIKYFFEDDFNNKFIASELINKIKELRTNYNDNQTLGIFQLWDGKRGKKIKAIFVSDDSKYIIRSSNNPNNNPTDDEITNQLNTEKFLPMFH